MGRSLRTLASLLFFVLALGGCAKKQETAKVKLTFPSWPSQESLSKSASVLETVPTYENISVIIVNITGPGIASPIYWQWDKHRKSGETAPTGIELPGVPRGTDRLIQVLVVFEGGGAIQFYYGDTLTALASEYNPVAIKVNALGGSAGHGSVAGRYLRADGTGPTGRVEMRFQPPGKPAMVVEYEYIYSGWFRFFALPTSNFTYRLMSTGEMLFENFNTGSVTPSGAHQAKVLVPAYWRYDDWSGGTPIGPRVQEAPQTNLVGFFGPGSSGKSVCFTNSVTPLNQVYEKADVTDATTIKWVGNATLDATKAGVVAGGTTTCGTAAQLFNSFVKIDESQAAQHDRMLGFSGPFRLQSTGGTGDHKQEILANHTGSGVTLTWKYVHGATDIGAIRGASVYYRLGVQTANNDQDYEGDDDGIDCQDLSSRYNFAFLQDVSASAGQMDASATIPAVPVADYSAGKFQAVVCPYIHNAAGTREYIPEGGVDFRAHYGGGGVVISPTKLAAYKHEGGVRSETTGASPATARAGSCVPLEIAAVDTQGNVGETGMTSLTISSPFGGETLSSYSDCSVDSDSAYPSFGGRAYVYIKDNGTSGNVTLTISAPGTGLSDGTAHVSFVSAVTANTIATIAPPSTRAYDCIPVVFRSEAGGIPAALLSSLDITYPSPEWRFYSDGRCSSAEVTSGTLNPATQHALSARYVGPSLGAVSIKPSALAGELTAAGAAIANASVNIVSQPNPAAKLAWTNLPSSVVAEDCHAVHVQLQDSNGQGAPMLSGLITTGNTMTISISTSNGGLYSSPGCVSATTTNTHISEFNSFSNMIYVKPASGGTMTLSATAMSLSAGTSIAAATTTITNVAAAVANRVVARLPGQIWDPGSRNVLGTPFTLIKGQIYNLDLYALTPGSNLDFAFNGTNSEVKFGGWVGGTVQPMNFSLSTWGNGHASAIYQPLTAGNLTVQTGGPGTSLNLQFAAYLDSIEANTFRLHTSTGFSRSACQPLLIESSSSSFGDAGSLPVASAVAVTITASGVGDNWVQYYADNDPNCATPIGTASVTVTFNPGESAKLLYIRTSDTSVTSLQFNSAAPGHVSSSSASFSTSPTTVDIEAKWQLVGKNSFKRGHCHAFAISRADSSGNATTDADPRQIQLAEAYGGMFYSDPNCGFIMPTLSFAAGESTKIFYYKNEVSDAAVLTFNLTETPAGGTPTLLSPSIPGSLNLNY